MNKSRLVLVAAILAALIAITAANAKPPKGAVRGSFTIGILANDEFARYMTASDVWCAWSKGHVIVHVNLKNRAIAHVTATIHPRYVIGRGGGTHGDGFTGNDYGFDAGELRRLWIDAGAPKGVPAKSPIVTCSPYLFLIKAG